MRQSMLVGVIEDPRPTGAQRIAAGLVRGARDDLARAPSCFRYQLALAWVDGRYPCGCVYEGPEMTFEWAARLLAIEPLDLRQLILPVNGDRREGRLCRGK
jgi:hypothetical protein